MLATLCALLLSCICGINASCESLGGPFIGRAKSYDAVALADGGEVCKFHTDGRLVAGVSTNKLQETKACGECLEVTGPNGQVVVTVVGKCHVCEENELKLSQDAFNTLTSEETIGKIDVTWRVVPCNEFGNIQYKIKDGSTRWYFGIQINRHRYPVESVEVRKPEQTDWLQLTRNSGNYFIKTSDLGGAMDFPIDVRVTASTGDVVEDTLAEMTIGELITGQSQFPSCGESGAENPDITEEEGVLDEAPMAPETQEETIAAPGEEAVADENFCERIRGGSIIHHGEGTFYREAGWAADGGGHCMTDTEGDIMVGAMNELDYANSEVCGECVEITGPDGDTCMVKIIDSCPECAEGDIDLSEEAFNLIRGQGRGRIPISWRLKECPVQGDFKLRFKDGSSKYWFGIQVLNHRYKVKKIQLRRPGEWQWIDLERSHYNFFLKSKMAGKIDAPFQLRIKSTNGQSVYTDVQEIISSQDVVFPVSGVQFAPCADSPNAQQA